MVASIVLAILAVLLPLVVLFFERTTVTRIQERHHSHHDTYTVPPAYVHGLVSAALIVGVLGLMVAWLCLARVMRGNAVTILVFTDSFVAFLLVAWAAARDYKISLFQSRMVATLPFGRSVAVDYASIDRMVWHGVRRSTGYRNLTVWADGRRVCTLWSTLDLERILMHIDRFDALV